LYGAPATVYCDGVTLIFASTIIIIIIIIISNATTTKTLAERVAHLEVVDDEFFDGIVVEIQVVGDQVDNEAVNLRELGAPLVTSLLGLRLHTSSAHHSPVSHIVSHR